MPDTRPPRSASTPPQVAAASPARDAALARLDRESLPGWKPRQLPERPKIPLDLAGHDAALAESLYIGAIKNLLLLRHRVSFHAGKPLKAIDPLVQKILVIGAWQLVGMTKIPPAVAVDQAVEQTRRFGRGKSAGLVNAVLRNFGRQPFTDPDPDADPELAYSVPKELFAKLTQAFGRKRALEISRHANTEPPLTLRLSPGVTAASLPCAPDVTVVPHDQPGLAVATGAKRDQIRAWFDAGLAQPQDPTAAQAVDLLDLRPGLSVLDRCAGVGTKTLQLRALLGTAPGTAPGTASTLHAIDPNPARCRTLEASLTARGYTDVHVHVAARTADVAGLPAAFDRVLCDVPCSNSGVLARRPEARYHQGSPALASLAKLQDQILTDSADRVAPAGLLLYSTCSIWHEENALRIKSFLARDPRFTLRAERTTLPAGPPSGTPTSYHDGGYTSLLVRDR